MKIIKFQNSYGYKISICIDNLKYIMKDGNLVTFHFYSIPTLGWETINHDNVKNFGLFFEAKNRVEYHVCFIANFDEVQKLIDNANYNESLEKLL